MDTVHTLPPLSLLSWFWPCVSVQVETHSDGTSKRGAPRRPHPSFPRYYRILTSDRVVKKPERFVFNKRNVLLVRDILRWGSTTKTVNAFPTPTLTSLLHVAHQTEGSEHSQSQLNSLSVHCLILASDFGKPIIRQLRVYTEKDNLNPLKWHFYAVLLWHWSTR